MYCAFCDNPKQIKGQIINHRYTESGLDNITLQGVIEHRCDQCGEVYYNYGNVEQLNNAIADILLAKKGLLTPKEIVFLRKKIGYNAAYFAKVLGYKASTISRLENGKQAITETFDHHVRQAVFNKMPDRDYDLHDRILNPRPMPSQINLKLTRSAWKFIPSPAI